MQGLPRGGQGGGWGLLEKKNDGGQIRVTFGEMQVRGRGVLRGAEGSGGSDVGLVG